MGARRPDAPQPRPAIDKAELLARAGEAAANAGRRRPGGRPWSARALAEVDPAADPLLAAQLTERLAFHLRIAGRPGAFEAYQEAVRLVPPEPSAARARVLAGLGQALMLRARFAEAASVCEEAIAVAREVGAPVVEAHALNSLGTAIARLDETDRGLACLEEARRRAAELGAAKDEARACVNLSDLLEDLGRLEESVAVATEGIEVADGGRPAPDLRAPSWPATPPPPCTTWAAGTESARRPSFLELGDDEDLNTVTLRQSRAVLDAGRGDFEGALAHVRAARRLSGDMFIAVQYPPVLAAAEAEVAAWQGRLEEAAAAVAEGLAALQGPLTDLRACMLLAIGLRVEGDRAALAAARHDHEHPGRRPAGRRRAAALGQRHPGRAGGGLAAGPAGHLRGRVRPGRRASSTRRAGWPRWPPGRRPATPTSWPWPAGGRPRRCWPGGATATWPPSLLRQGHASGHDPGRRAAPPRAGAAGQAGPGGAGPGPPRPTARRTATRRPRRRPSSRSA